MFFRLRAIFLQLQNGHTTLLKNFIDEKRTVFSFRKKRRCKIVCKGLKKGKKWPIFRSDFFQKIFQKKVLVISRFWQQFSYITWYFWTEWHCQNHDLRPGTRKSAKNLNSECRPPWFFFTFSNWKGKELPSRSTLGIDLFFWFSGSGPQIVILFIESCSEPSSYIRKLLSKFWYHQNFFLKIFLKKIISENRPFFALF